MPLVGWGGGRGGVKKQQLNKATKAWTTHSLQTVSCLLIDLRGRLQGLEVAGEEDVLAIDVDDGGLVVPIGARCLQLRLPALRILHQLLVLIGVKLHMDQFTRCISFSSSFVSDCALTSLQTLSANHSHGYYIAARPVHKLYQPTITLLTLSLTGSGCASGGSMVMKRLR